MTTVAWFRRDLRVDRNPILAAGGDVVVPLFVVDPRLFRPGQRRTDELVRRLHALDGALGKCGGRLRVEWGHPEDVVPTVVGDVGADRVLVNLDVSPYARHRDAAVADRVPLSPHWGTLVQPPDAVRTVDGGPYRVFTPFHRAWQSLDRPPPPSVDFAPTSAVGDGLPPLGNGPPVESETLVWARAAAWASGPVDRYQQDRDRPDLDGTSHLSIDLKYGSVDPGSLLAAVGEGTDGRRAFVRQLAWRDFWAQLIWHHPSTVDQPLNPRFIGFPWRDAPDELAAWAEGRTGVPIVDAGMRQLLATGWMHNRVRMVVASFLVKHLLIDWRAGERVFRRLLLDGDVPQNVGNWQWVAGTGADAAPYFRVFNPLRQAARFDPDGAFVRRWVPELADLPMPALHAPWEAGPLELAAAGVDLGATYPEPIVGIDEGRDRALAAWAAMRG
jgi:deoxyribodipyrimidine photo-lyase